MAVGGPVALGDVEGGAMIILTGSTGFLGSAIFRRLCADDKYRQVIGLGGRSAGDLREYPAALVQLLLDFPGATLIHCAYPGTEGIATSLTHPATLAAETLQIDLNVLQVAAEYQVKKLICFGSVCAYAEQVSLPADESQLWLNAPELVNAPYGHARRMQLALLQAYRRECGLVGVHLILDNLYGPGDTSGHVIPATIQKCLAGEPSISVWGDGTATREFLYIDDAVDAIIRAIDAPDSGPEPINIVSNHEISIAEVVGLVSTATGYAGAVVWDPSKPNGQPRRWFTHDRATAVLGWRPKVRFTEGVEKTVNWWKARRS